MSVMEDVEGHGHTRAPDDFEELEEERELLEFVESSFCVEAVLEYFKADENTKNEEILEKAGRLLDGLIYGMNVLSCIERGEIVCVGGELYPGSIVKPDRGVT